MNKIARILVTPALLVLLCAPQAFARDTISDQPVQAAVDSGIGKDKLRDIPFFMAGAQHGKVIDDLGVYTSNRRTNAFGKSDADACTIAFLSAIIALQDRAKSLGGDAVIDIKSITKNQNLESATQFRCDAGGLMANVALSGRAVKLAK